jgi:hypothetical protein
MIFFADNKPVGEVTLLSDKNPLLSNAQATCMIPGIIATFFS